MTTTDLWVLLPMLIIAAAAVVVMLVSAFYRRHRLVMVLTLLGFATAFAALFWIRSLVPRSVTTLLVMDSYALFYMGLLFAASFAVALLAYGYLRGREEHQEELYVLLLLATLGSATLVMSTHFASFFLGLEILSIGLYAMIAYLPTRERCLEAGLKYLVLGGVSASFLLFGMALVYADTGTMVFSELRAPYSSLGLMGFALMIVGLGFKLAVVPFHLWTPDVYEGAPAPVTAFVATVSKGGVFALLLRYFAQSNAYAHDSVTLAFTWIAIASMFVGNLLALRQTNVKRILAYSSIAHLGYLLVAFLAAGELAIQAVTYYLVAYFVTTLGAFGVVSVLSQRERDADALDDYRALFWRQPWLAAVFTAMLFSLAGMPLTAGFIGKFYVVAAGVGSRLWLLVVLLAINSAIGLYYYLRLIGVMYAAAEENGEETGQRSAGLPALSLTGGILLAMLTLLLIWLGVYPAALTQLIPTILGG